MNARTRRSKLWVDVGGTRTQFILDRNGVRKPLRAIPSQPANLKWDLTRILRQLPDAPTAIHVGMRGVWTPTEKKKWRAELKPHKNLIVTSDVELAHEMAFGKNPGVTLVAGTGSIAVGRKTKKLVRAGGLGPLLGDEGSAFWMGREFLRMQTGPKFSWRRLRKWSQDPRSVRRVAALAQRVLSGQSAAARRIRAAASICLANLILKVRNDLRWRGRAPLYLHGGLFENRLFRREFVRALPRGKFLVQLAPGR